MVVVVIPAKVSVDVQHAMHLHESSDILGTATGISSIEIRVSDLGFERRNPCLWKEGSGDDHWDVMTMDLDLHQLLNGAAWQVRPRLQ